MAEYIEREALLRHLEIHCEDCCGEARHCIVSAPAADVVEVVRCKDCKHFSPFVEPFNKVGNCRKSVGLNTENHFCSYGERRADNGHNCGADMREGDHG